MKQKSFLGEMFLQQRAGTVPVHPCRTTNATPSTYEGTLMKMSSRFAIGLISTTITAGASVTAHAEAGRAPHQATPIVFQAAGPDAISIQSAVDAFRAKLGALNPNVAGSFGAGRREINWDGVPDALSAPNNMPADFFNATSPRGAIFDTPGSGFQVSAKPGNPTGTPVRFGNLNSTYPELFSVFSPQRLFTALGSNVSFTHFFVPGSSVPATTSGFGVVFTDVGLRADQARCGESHHTRVAYFDADGNSLFEMEVPATTGEAGLSFVGAFFPDDRVATVGIVSGSKAPGPDDEGCTDVVVMDDFIYGEPR